MVRSLFTLESWQPESGKAYPATAESSDFRPHPCLDTQSVVYHSAGNAADSTSTGNSRRRSGSNPVSQTGPCGCWLLHGLLRPLKRPPFGICFALLEARFRWTFGAWECGRGAQSDPVAGASGVPPLSQSVAAWYVSRWRGRFLGKAFMI